jgi:KTSC domain-containing protein
VNRRPVQSSNIASIGWEPNQEGDSQGTLEVAFRSGHLFQYENVPEGEYRALLGASSVGKMMNSAIIGRYEEHEVS